MDVTAIISEYNPFHNGHKYQIDAVKSRFPDTSVIAVMSPDFVQRGQPAVFDKYVRGRCAVSCGADLAVSMPLVFSLSSAEGFAEGGVRLARMMGANALSFGVEDDDIDALTAIADVLITDKFEKALQEALTSFPSLPYASVRQKVLEDFIGKSKGELIKKPNNILAIEYIKAAMRYCPEMEFRPVKRMGKGHNDSSTEGSIISASAIRSIIDKPSLWKSSMPDRACAVLYGQRQTDMNKYRQFLYYVLTVADYETIVNATGSKELADTVYSSIKKARDFEKFRSGISRRKFPETRIDRALLCALLKLGYDEFMHSAPEYATVLAMNSEGRKILKNAEVPLLSRYSNFKKISGKQIETELLADRIWARCLDISYGDEYFINKKPFIAEDIQ